MTYLFGVLVYLSLITFIVAFTYENGTTFFCEGRRKCVYKCCYKGEFVVGAKTCTKYSQLPQIQERDFSDVDLYDASAQKVGKGFDESFTLAAGKFNDLTFKRKHYNLKLMGDGYFVFYLTEDGKLMREDISKVRQRWLTRDNGEFCIDYQQKKDSNVSVLSYFYRDIRKDPPLPKTDIVAITGLQISIFFLAVVLVIYSLCEKLRNWTGWLLMACVANLLVHFILLSVINLLHKPPQFSCYILAIIEYFTTLSCFFWMNIMSIDSWRCFSHSLRPAPDRRRKTYFYLRRLAKYSVYAFGVPLLMAAGLVAIQENDERIKKALPLFIRPQLKKGKCYLDEVALVLYVYVPLLLIILCNSVLFALTVFNIRRSFRASRRAGASATGKTSILRSQWGRVQIYFKLSVIMGVNWVLDIFTFTLPHSNWLRIINNVYNGLIGLTIFLMFVCKKQTYKELVKEYQRRKRWCLRAYRRAWQRNSPDADDQSEQETPRRTELSNLTSISEAESEVCMAPGGPI